MVILKYFYEEPAALETLTPDADPDARQQSGPTMSLEAFLNQPRYYRGYLAGTVMEPHRVGLTAVQPAALYTTALAQALPFETWHRVVASGAVSQVQEVAALWAAPASGMVLIGGGAGPDWQEAVWGDADRRQVIPAMRAVLDAGGVVAFAEPAHDGFDWSIFSPFPLKDRMVAAWGTQPTERARRFVVPYRQARSEQKFYFEQWMLDAGPLPRHIEEV
ncbi:MAG: hypothetical protein RhofKO_26240 [Rhodothermales bacterium]